MLSSKEIHVKEIRNVRIHFLQSYLSFMQEEVIIALLVITVSTPVELF